jgi:adenine/guanine/hypoxanthine permease
MERGYIFTCVILAAASACLIDGKFYRAAVWALVAAALTFLGLMHAYQLTGNSVDYLFRFSTPAEKAFAFRADGIACGWLLFAAVLAAFGRLRPGASTS